VDKASCRVADDQWSVRYNGHGRENKDIQVIHAHMSSYANVQKQHYQLHWRRTNRMLSRL